MANNNIKLNSYLCCYKIPNNKKFLRSQNVHVLLLLWNWLHSMAWLLLQSTNKQQQNIYEMQFKKIFIYFSFPQFQLKAFYIFASSLYLFILCCLAWSIFWCEKEWETINVWSIEIIIAKNNRSINLSWWLLFGCCNRECCINAFYLQLMPLLIYCITFAIT